MVGAVTSFQQAFPIVVIDEDFDSRHAGGRAVRELAAALREQGFEVLTGVGYQDARRLTRIYHNESSLLISVDGAEASNGQWASLEDLLTVTRRRNTRVPIFLLGDERTAESVPTEVLKHTQAFFRLNEDAPEYLARTIARSAQLYIDTLLPPMFRALTEYASRGSDAWPRCGHDAGAAFRKSPVGRIFYEFFGENLVRTDVGQPVPGLGTPPEGDGAIGAAQRSAARIFGSDHTRFVAAGAAAANRIVWQGLVAAGDLVVCDRSADASILHAMIMTGAVPVYLHPVRNPLGLAGPVARDQLTPHGIQQTIASSGQTHVGGRVRLLTLTNSTSTGICYSGDAIKSALGDTVDVLHFDERWLAYANFHEFYLGHHAMSSVSPRRARKAVTCATQSTHTTLAAISPGAMLHVLDGDTERADLARLDAAFAMHSSSSPQYAVLASCDVAAAIMEQPAGRAIVEEALDEALAFRRAIAAVKRTSGAPWWFGLWQPPALAEYPVADPARWRLNAADRWHGFGTTIPDDMLLDPLKVMLLTPRADERMPGNGIPAPVVAMFLKGRRIEVEHTGMSSLLVPFSMGVAEGRWSSLITELLSFRDLYERNAPLRDVLPNLVDAHPRSYANMGLRDLCLRVQGAYAHLHTGRPQDDPHAVLPKVVMRPADAYECAVRGQIDRVEVDQLISRVVAVQVVPQPPGIALLMPGERISEETAAIQHYLLRVRQFDVACPGFEIQVDGLRVEQEGAARRYVVDCIRG